MPDPSLISRLLSDRLQFREWLSVIVLLCQSGCSTLKIESPPGNHRVVLGAFRSDCRIRAEEKQWGLLFGVISLNRPDLSEALRDPQKSYRIRESYDWEDVLIDIFGGALVTLNRRTITVEECKEVYVVRTPGQIDEERQQILQASLDLYLRDYAPRNEEAAAVILTSGETKIGRIVEVTTKEIVLSVKKKLAAPKPVDRVILREGGVLLGDIIRQSRDSVTLRTGKGMQEIDKKRIRFVLFHRTEPKPTEEEASNEVASEKKTETFFMERVHIQRGDIRQIVLKWEVANLKSGSNPQPPVGTSE